MYYYIYYLVKHLFRSFAHFQMNYFLVLGFEDFFIYTMNVSLRHVICKYLSLCVIFWNFNNFFYRGKVLNLHSLIFSSFSYTTVFFYLKFIAIPKVTRFSYVGCIFLWLHYHAYYNPEWLWRLGWSVNLIGFEICWDWQPWDSPTSGYVWVGHVDVTLRYTCVYFFPLQHWLLCLLSGCHELSVFTTILFCHAVSPLDPVTISWIPLSHEPN